ncbi:TonB-dependent receptor plug domain-containing protein [Kordiimonas aquimaris]|uniref:TonB-dependent receptor plug domain-containing protein n=1 Tax=Kordiimonas aquimaris TaxID=707591 RepID=UPI0021D0D10A|nr:TonB-dependent receptor [Kordiimonas aquimaris]
MKYSLSYPLSVLSLFCAASAGAQQSDAADDNVENVIVTGTRIPTRVSDIASPVTIISAEELAARQTVRLVDVLATLPGIAVQRTGSVGGQTQLRLRGAEANQTLILIDGVEANDPAAGDEVQLEHLVTTGIERIEIIRGPQSAAWGSDALAGVINIVTKKGTGDLSLGAHAEAGSFGTFNGGFTASGGGDGWHLNGGFNYLDASGTNVSRVGDEDDGYRNVTANVRGGFDITDTISFDASIRHTDAENEADAADFLVTGLPADSDNVTDTRSTVFGAGVKGVFLDGAWTQGLRITWLDTEIENTAGGAPNGATAAERFSFYADARLKLDDNHALTLLFDHEESDFSQRGVASPFGDPNQDQERSVTGYGADYTGQWVPNFTVTASIRRDDNDGLDDFTSWRFGASYSYPETGTRLFANVARGQKAPTFLELFGFFADQFIGNPNLEPERSTNYEAGIEQTWLDGRVMTRATYFSANLRNEINGFVFDPVTFQFTADNVDGRSTREGIELELDATVNKALTLRANYAYLRSREPDAGGVLQQEVRRPRHSADVFVSYQPTDAFSVTANASYTGEAIDTFFPPFPQPSERVTLNDYVLVNITGQYAVNETVTVYGRAENLFDTNYENVFGFNTPGLGVFGGVRVKF